jgi:hypothetical protein
VTGTLLGAITDAACAVNDNGSVMVTEYVVLASYVDNEGVRAVYLDTVDGQTCTQSLGLLAFGMAIENKHAGEE